MRLPAKRVPDAVEKWIRMYEAERNEGEEFNAFAERVGTGRFEEEIAELALPAEFNLDNLLEFIDWNRRDPYKVERGEGECASEFDGLGRRPCCVLAARVLAHAAPCASSPATPEPRQTCRLAGPIG